MNLGDEYQNFFVFIALLISGDEAMIVLIAFISGINI